MPVARDAIRRKSAAFLAKELGDVAGMAQAAVSAVFPLSAAWRSAADVAPDDEDYLFHGEWVGGSRPY